MTAQLLDAAVDELVHAVEAVEDLPKLRFGVVGAAHGMRIAGTALGDAAAEVERTADVWLALDRVVASVASSRALERG